MAATILLFSSPLTPLSRAPQAGSQLQETPYARSLRAAGDRAGLADQTVCDGVYCPWTVEDSDVREVLLSYCTDPVWLLPPLPSSSPAASAAFLPKGNAAGDAIRQRIDLFCATGAAGLGLSLVLIHICVTPIKRFLQALWAVLGSIGTYLAGAQPLDESLVRYVLEHPAALWFVGPTFAVLAGLVFKEGLCYGNWKLVS